MQREFINVAAHELRTPVQPILGLADLLSRKKGDIEQYQEFITIIGRNACQLKHLTEDILDGSRIDGNLLDLREDAFDLVKTIMELLDDYRKDQAGFVSGLDISFESNVDAALVRGDKQRICQVIQNLLDNAFNFTKSGSITVSLSATTLNAKEWNIAVKILARELIRRSCLDNLINLQLNQKTDRFGAIYFKEHSRGAWWEDLGQ